MALQDAWSCDIGEMEDGESEFVKPGDVDKKEGDDGEDEAEDDDSKEDEDVCRSITGILLEEGSSVCVLSITEKSLFKQFYSRNI